MADYLTKPLVKSLFEDNRKLVQGWWRTGRAVRTINRDRVQPTTTFCMIKAKTRTGALTYGNYTGPYKYIPESTNSTVLVALNKLGQARAVEHNNSLVKIISYNLGR